MTVAGLRRARAGERDAQARPPGRAREGSNMMDRRMLGFAAMTILASSCFDGPDPAASSEGERSDDAATRPLRHELVGLRPVDGKYPILDIQDSPGGRRYSMEVGASKACNDCPVEIHEGVFERQMTRRPTAAAPARLLAPVRSSATRSRARSPGSPRRATPSSCCSGRSTRSTSRASSSGSSRPAR